MDLRAEAVRAAQAAGIDPDLFLRLVQQESGFNANAVSPKGALGPAQLMPATAAELGVDPNDPIQNLQGGARYLADMFDEFGGNPYLALAAYNAGAGNVRKHGGIPPFQETQNYVARIMGGTGSDTLAGGAGGDRLTDGGQYGGPNMEPERTGLLGFLGNDEQRARAALALSGLSMFPNQGVQTLARNTIEQAQQGRADQREQAKTDAQMNRTIQVIQNLKTPQAVMALDLLRAGGSVTDALKMAFATAEPERGVVVGNNVVDPLTGRIIYQGQTDTDEDTRPAAFVALDMQARAAGLLPRSEGGDGAYEMFMLTKGAGTTAEAAARAEANVDRELNRPNVQAQIETAQASLDLINEVMGSPYLNSVTGMVQGRLPATTQGGTDLTTRIDQLQGQAFLQAFESLKGGGAITEAEGRAATNAIARLNRVQSAEAFRAGLRDLQMIYQRAIDRINSGSLVPPTDTGTAGSGVTVGEGF